MNAGHGKTLRKRGALALFALVVAFFLYVVFGSAENGAGASVSASGKWTCSMCPQFILPQPGKCPKCFMDLIPLDEGLSGGSRLELYLTPAAAELAGITTEIVEEDASGDFSVAASAILASLGRAFVFVESLEEDSLVYTLREVGLAGRDGDRALIASGLDEGEAVVASGAFRIDSAMQILGKISLAAIPEGDLAAAATDEPPPYQPAERSPEDIRAQTPGVDDWFARYEAVRAALARDDAGRSSPPSREFAALLADFPRSSRDELNDIAARLAVASRDLSQAAELEGKRAAFAAVTADMVLLARRYGASPGGLNLVFCPMAFGGTGAYWLQPGDTVDNPYHGLEMPLCGWIVDAIEPFATGQNPSPAPDQD